MLKQACQYLLIAYKKEGLTEKDAQRRLAQSLTEISRDYISKVKGGPGIYLLLNQAIDQAGQIGLVGISLRNILIDIKLILEGETR